MEIFKKDSSEFCDKDFQIEIKFAIVLVSDNI